MIKNILFFVFTLCSVFNLSAQYEDIFINEFMLSNDVTLSDEDNDYPDWIEIYNANNISVNLEGFGLSDDGEDPLKWVFPSVDIPPGGFLVVFASGKNRISGVHLHTNFKLTSDGELIQLTAPDLSIVDQTPPVSVGTDIAYGRTKDGGEQLESLSASSPGASNTSVNGITFSHQSGFYTDPIIFDMLANNNDPIYYTIDGSDPSTASILFNGSIELGYLDDHLDVISNIPTSPYWTSPNTDQFNAHVIKAATFNNGEKSSKTYHKTFFIDAEIKSRFDDFYLISIITDQTNLFHQDTGIYVPGVHFDSSNPVWSGNYFQKGVEWERTGYVQYFTPNGKMVLDQGIGLRIHGGKGRNYPQKSFRLYARSKYGSPKMNYPFFEDQKRRVFDKLILKNSMSCWNKTIFKDECTAKVCENLNFESLDSKPAIVFINGEYWGIQNIREYFDHYHIAEKYGLDKDSVNVVLHMSGIQSLPEHWGTDEGSNESHAALYDFLESHDLYDDANYQHVKTFLDIQSIIDYYCAEIYFNNKDWPRYNNKLWSYGAKGLWKQVLFDVDGGWGYLGVSNNILSCISETPGCYIQTQADGTFLFRKLIESQEFIDQFVERMACLMRNDFAPKRVNAIVADFKSQYINGVNEHIDRWDYPNSLASWESSIASKLINFSDGRQAHIIAHISEQFNIDFDPGIYDCEEGIITSTSPFARPTNEALLTVIPNPSYTNQISLDYNLQADQIDYEIYNLNGQCLQRGQTTKREKITLNFESGIYLIRVLTDDRLLSGRIMLLTP